jgi:hypothetical protein
MSDTEIAKQRLKEDNVSLVIVKDSHLLFSTKAEGIHGLIRAIEELKHNLTSASVADIIVGKAAAFLCAFAGISSVYAVTMSRSGLAVLRRYGLSFSFETLVPTILGRGKSGKCPLEKLVEDVTEAEQAYGRIKEFVRH